MSFHEFIRSHRIKKYSSGRAFYRSENLSCSYYHYSLVEQGKSTPKIELVVELAEKLKLNLQETINYWVGSQLPDKYSHFYFPDKSIYDRLDSDHYRARKLPINRMQGKLLNSNEIYWHLISYLALYKNQGSDMEKLRSIFGSNVNILLENLYDHGLVNKNGEEYQPLDYYLIPYTKEMHSLRNSNLKSYTKNFLSTPEIDKYRGITQKLLDENQFESLRERMNNVLTWMWNLPERTENSFPVTACFFMYKRDFENEY